MPTVNNVYFGVSAGFKTFQEAKDDVANAALVKIYNINV